MASFSEYTNKIKNSISDIYENYILKHIINRFFKKSSKILFLGIDNAGKTTLVNKLKNNINHIFPPTKFSTESEVEIGNLKAKVVDIGGHKQVRMAWKDYFTDIDGIIFIVDINDDERYDEVSEAWKSIRTLDSDVPIVVFINKIDMVGETTESIPENSSKFNMYLEQIGLEINNDNNKVVFISIIRENPSEKNSNLCKAFEWLSIKVDEKNKKKSL